MTAPQRPCSLVGMLRKIGIVALARKLLVALWRYLTAGVVPAGAILVDWKGKMNSHRKSAGAAAGVEAAAA